MRIGITGEEGFIAKNLSKQINDNWKDNTYVSVDSYNYILFMMKYTHNNEVCVYRNSIEQWVALFKNLELDVIVHNAAVVGTDVVALNPVDAIKTNVLGTKIITEAANLAGILNVYIGTTVIYDTYMYQTTEITEDSVIYPRTDYAIQKYAGEMIVRNNAKKWLVMRPLFAYGGLGDMNSLISKTLYGITNNVKNIDMFLDSSKIKDYMHVEDFCFAVIQAINSNVRNEHFNIPAQNPTSTLEIINMIQDITGKYLEDTIKWHPKTDYLGNHRLSDKKFIKYFGKPSFRPLRQGIKEAWNEINNNADNFNPLKHLEEAKEKDIDLTKFFPKD